MITLDNLLWCALAMAANLAVWGVVWVLGSGRTPRRDKPTRQFLAALARDTPAYRSPTVWSDAVLPGGQVCAVPMSGMPGAICGYPVESEPCPLHPDRRRPQGRFYNHETEGL